MTKYQHKTTRSSRRSLNFSVQQAFTGRAASGLPAATFTYNQGIPSYPSDCLRDSIRIVYAEAGASALVASGTVDDQVTIAVVGGGSYTSPSGAGVKIDGSIPIPGGGYYLVTANHTNIDYPPNANVSNISCSVTPVTDIIGIVPDENEPPSECTCECTCASGSDNDGGPSQQNNDNSENLSPSAFSARSSSGSSSSAGSGVRRSSVPQEMSWSCNVASFRGMPGVPSARLELRARSFDAESLASPASLCLRHPLATVLHVPQGGVMPNQLVCLDEGDSYLNFMCSGAGNFFFPVGASVSTRTTLCAVAEMSLDAPACSLSGAAYIRATRQDGSALFFLPSDGSFAGMLTPAGALLSAENAADYLVVLRDEESDAIRQIWNPWDGLTEVLPREDAPGYTISFYLPAQVTPPAQDAESPLYVAEGTPFRTVSVAVDATVSSLTVTEHDAEQPESMEDVTTRWSFADGVWSRSSGSGDALITESRTRTDDAAAGTYSVVTTLSCGDAVASCVQEAYDASGAQGDVLLSRTEGFGTPLARTTSFEYNRMGQLITRTAPDGGVTTYAYDTAGRVVKESSPWGANGERVVETTYRTDGSSRSSEPARIVTKLATASSVATVRTEEYTYLTDNEVERVECRTTAGTPATTQLTVTETYTAAYAHPHAAGRPRMSQAANGVQTWYQYTATSLHGALYSVTTETRVEGAPVAGQSIRSVEYISADGNVLCSVSYLLLSSGVWALTSGESHQYDAQNRRIATLHDNGRSRSCGYICTGELLWEVDEDGVRTDYGYDASRRLVETIRSEVRDGETVITPETITTYTRDAAGRVLSTRRDIGAMTTTESTAYDILGRVTSRTDSLGRITSTAYSADGLTTTLTTPAGATLITTRNRDGSVAHLYGTGQRELYYVYDTNGNNARETVKPADNTTILSQTITTDFGQVVAQAQPNANGGFIYSRSEYNALGQLTKQYQDTGWNTAKTAATLYEYDTFGNVVKQTLALASSPTPQNSPVTEMAYGAEALTDGIYRTVTRTRYNAAGNPLLSVQKSLVSKLSDALESKNLTIDERNLTSAQWVEYHGGTKRKSYNTLPTSNITAEAVTVDGFTLSQTDNTGVTTTNTRSYTANGMIHSRTDGRGNTTTTVTDIAGRTLTVTDAAGNVTTTAYDPAHDLPATVTDAQGNTSCYRYDARGRKLAEWGTGMQPVMFDYDDADRMVMLTTFRCPDEVITTDPTETAGLPSQSSEGAAAGDTTTWTYHDASGLETAKTYADNSFVVKTYDDYNRVLTETDARGNIKTHSYEPARGLLLGTSYSLPSQSSEGTAAGASTTPRAYTYNHLGQLTQVSDAAGVRTLSYNTYGEQESDSLVADGVTHLITETRDEKGRSTGYTYAKNGTVQQTVTTDYGSDGRIATAGFLHGGAEKQFSYEYLSGTHLLEKLTMPNNMTLTQSYEIQRDLLTGMAYKRGSTLVANRQYSYDTLGRPTARNTSRQGTVKNDTFGYNNRSELTSATVNGSNYAYNYDNIGNRETATESEITTSYTANELNQYTAVGDFAPTFDADGNQTLVKSSAGIWSITYDAENRPVSFTNAESNTVVECAYDHMGRRATKKVTVDGAITLHQRYLYRGYLQIACCDLTRSNHPALWFITWDPTQPIATRPLAIQKDGTWYTYGWDLTKNICELYGTNGYIRTTYTYTPYGEVTESANSVYQPIQWSSEYNDTELGMVYYNYRHYNPMDGRWSRRDSIEYNNLYIYINNIAIYSYDYIGLLSISDSANISEVDRSELGEEIGRMNPVVMPVIPHYKTGCFMRIVVPDTELKVTIELANKDIDYLAEMKALIESTNNKFIDLKYARNRTREHELEHFRDYKRVKRIYLNFLNNVYDGFTCKFEKLNKLKNALNEYINARINADAVELDMRDYLLEKKESKIAERPKVYQKLMEAEINYAKAHLEYYE